MGWRGALRSIAAAQRAAERQAVRTHRQHERIAKEAAKLEALRQAAFEVERHENWVERITSIHRDAGAAWDWALLAKTPQPTAPVPCNRGEKLAAEALRHYQPSWFDKLLRRGESKRSA